MSKLITKETRKNSPGKYIAHLKCIACGYDFTEYSRIKIGFQPERSCPMCFNPFVAVTKIVTNQES